MDGITLDGVHYRVCIRHPSMSRSFRLPDGPNAGEMLSGRHERDLVGTYYDYSLEVEPDPRYPGDYDAFYEAISAPIDSHSITLPYGQSTITYNAEVSEGFDTYRGILGGINRWTGLIVNFAAIKPQRAVD